jgi:hypothetical protein
MTITPLVLLILATICFLLTAANVTLSPRLNLLGLGLFFWTLSLLAGAIR